MTESKTEAARHGSGLGCFLSNERMCGADCMAYSATLPEGKTYQGEQWPHCLVLLNLERGSRHLTILAQEAMKFFAFTQKHAADQARANQQPPTVK